MSQTILSVLVMLASQFLPMIGVQVGSEQLTQAITTIVTIAAGIWIWVRRYQQGDVTKLGKRV